MKITIIESGYFKLDGGAMFGVVPKKMWQKLNPPDEQNMCTWAMRCLLIEQGDRKILIDTGMGDKQDAKFRSHFSPFGEKTLVESLADAGLAPGEITDVLLTHFHFDHVGGAVKIGEKGDYELTFPNATHWTNELHYNWAFDPNPRERASFLKENFVPILKSGKLKYIDVQKEDLNWLPNIDLRFVYGHTEAMMLPIINYNGQKILYCADLMPSTGHIGLPYVMAYDIRPLVTIEERRRMIEEATTQDLRLFLEHDPKTALISLKRNDRGRAVLGEVFENF